MLKTALKVRQQVEIILPDDREESYRSFFVGLDGNSSGFYMDMLIPRPGRGALRSGAAVVIVFFLNDIQYRLTALFSGVEKHLGFDSLKFARPLTLERAQRRASYRVEPGVGRPVKALVKSDERVERTTALDISVGGLRYRSRMRWDSPQVELDIELPGDWPPLENVRMNILSQGRIDPSGKGRPLEKPCYVRGEFVSLENRCADIISRYVAARQREINRLF
ncbi:MAG: hypothetical protein ACNS63_08955 [Candidatus Nitrospinota bacterium M3_3B_026]